VKVSEAVIVFTLFFFLTLIIFHFMRPFWYRGRTTPIVRSTEMPMCYQVLHLKRFLSMGLHATLKSNIVRFYIQIAVFQAILNRLDGLLCWKVLTNVEDHIRLQHV